MGSEQVREHHGGNVTQTQRVQIAVACGGARERGTCLGRGKGAAQTRKTHHKARLIPPIDAQRETRR